MSDPCDDVKKRRRSRRIAQRETKRKYRLTGLLTALLDSSPSTSIPWSRGPTAHEVPPPLAPQPSSTLSFWSVQTLPDTKPLPWLSQHTTYDANADLEEVAKVLFDPAWVRTRLAQSTAKAPHVRTRSMLHDHVRQQLSWGKLVEDDNATIFMPFFTRLKSNGISTRPIYDASALKEILGTPHSPKLPTPAFIIDFAMQFRRAASFDLAGWYSQIPVGETLSRCLGIDVDGTHYRYVTLPQGFGESCWIAETIATRLCSGIEASVAGIVYDNFLFCAENDTQLASIVNVFDHNLRRCVVVKNEEKTTIGQKVEYCGLSLDLEEKTFAVTGEWSTKAAPAIRDALALRQWTFRTAFAIFGLCAWYLRVTRQPFCMVRPILSAQRLVGRRIHRGATWSSSFSPAPSLRSTIRRIHDSIAANAPIPWHEPPELQLDSVAYSDASDWGWGIVWVNQGRVADVQRGAWTCDERHTDIHIREIIAFRKARAQYPTATLYLVDNTVTVNAVRKGHSPRPSLDFHLRSPEVLSLRTFIAWVPTAENIADFPSRAENHPLPATTIDMHAAVKDLQLYPVDWTYHKHELRSPTMVSL